MLEALNEFLGRTTVDSSLEVAYLHGRLEDALRDCGFPPRAAASLSQLEASSFSAYLQALYEEVMRQHEEADTPPHPWPTEGLYAKSRHRQRNVEAA